MDKQYFKNYSPAMGHDMECQIYGHSGTPLLFIPCQDGHYYDFENFHMAEKMSPWIESGKLMVISVNTIDEETWSNKIGNPRWRAERFEQWIRYITEEVVPMIQHIARERNGWNDLPRVLTMGCSLGATHALNLFLRRPDIFGGTLAISGIYTADYGFDGYKDELVYLNSPVDYMWNMPYDHPYIQMYNNSKIIVVAGQGAWEQPATTITMKNIFEKKGINAWVDLWGFDVNHDWPWWYKMVDYFMPYLLGEK